MYVTSNPGIVGQILKQEAVLLLPTKGEVKVLNEVGARIWQLADGTRTIAEIAAVISTEYAVQPAQAEADTLAFVAELAERGIVTLAPQRMETEARSGE
jgi:hypothetical protein